MYAVRCVSRSVNIKQFGSLSTKVIEIALYDHHKGIPHNNQIDFWFLIFYRATNSLINSWPKNNTKLTNTQKQHNFTYLGTGLT